jgi:hypothetical protein
MGDMASKAMGGGMFSANTHGPCKFIGPGSMDVTFEGKNVQLLGDPMTNNGAGGGSPANSATMSGEGQLSAAYKKEIRAAMKKEEKVCPAKNPTFPEHDWEEEPTLPKGSTEDTVKKLRESKSADARFEGLAAQKNIDDGDLTVDARDRHSKVSRDTTDDEKKAGEKGDDHKVFRECRRRGCGVKAEVDHVVGKNGQAEAKNVGTQFDSFDQMRRNRTIQRQTGATIMYKINGDNPNASVIKETIEYAARVGGLRTLVKLIF